MAEPLDRHRVVGRARAGARGLALGRAPAHFSPPFDAEDWFSLIQGLPERDRSAFIPLALSTTLALAGDGRAFLWCIEALWLSLEPAQRGESPSAEQDWSNPDRTWVNAYVERLPADLDQFARLFPPPGAESALSLWIDQARRSDPSWVSPRNRDRLDSWERLERTLQSGVPHSMLQIPSSEVPETDRGRWLSHILEGLGTADRPGYLDDLEACGRAWSQAFESGSPHLETVAEPLAKALEPLLDRPQLWVETLTNMESRLRVPDREDAVRSVGLAAHVLARTSRERQPQALWNLRRRILRSADWPILRLDLKAAIESQPAEQAASVVETWDTQVTEGSLGLRGSFHTLILNACSGQWLARVGSARAQYLKEDVLPWWDHDQAVAGRNDARDAFARLVPMDPLPYENLPALRTWLKIPPAEFDESLTHLPEPVLPNEQPGLVPEDLDDSRSSASPPDFSHFSALGLARWCALHGLTALADGSLQRSRDVYERIRLLPMNRLDTEDRYRFLAWLLLLTDLTDTSFADPLARWLVEHGAADDERLKDWSSPIAHRIARETSLQRPGLLEFIHALGAEVRRLKQERREKPRGSSRSRSDTSL